MREFAVGYDEDGRGGTYFQFCATTFGHRVFFEVGQRVNGYDGHGSPNTWVRAVAQHHQLLFGGVIA